MVEVFEVMTQDTEKVIKTLSKTPVEELCYSSNIHESLCSPPQFKKYLIPFYQRTSKQIHDSGKYLTVHYDGFVKKFLPLLRETGIDGYECVTPKPQGDVTLEEIKKYIIDEEMFLRDGIPAILFTNRYPVKELEAFTYKILNSLGKSGRLQLGISDLLPSNGEIERVRLVGKIVEKWNYENFG
jgi:hypothetical protein